MAWMSVTDTHKGEHVINVDEVVRFSPLGTGTFIEMTSGSQLALIDSFESLKQVVMQADAKKAK